MTGTDFIILLVMIAVVVMPGCVSVGVIDKHNKNRNKEEKEDE